MMRLAKQILSFALVAWIVGIATPFPFHSTGASTLTINIWGGAYEKTLREHVIVPFERETGAKVNVVLGSAPLPRLMAERGRPSIDVLHMGGLEAVTAEKNGLLERLNPVNIPSASDLYREAVQSPYWVATNWGAYGIAYDAVKVKAPPTSWFDLWKPEYRNRVIMYDIAVSDATSSVMFLLAEVMSGKKVQSIKDLEPVFAKLRELKPNVWGYMRSHADTEAAFTRGDVWLAIWTNGRARTLQEAGLPIAFAIPREGAPALTTVVGISRGTKALSLAERFVDFTLKHRAQLAFATLNFYAPTNRKVVLGQDLAKWMPYGPEQVRKLYVPNYDILTRLQPDIVERFQQIMK